MRKRTALALSVLLSFIVGCENRRDSSPTVGKGDVRQFIIAQSLSLGGRPAQTNDLPPLKTEWSFQRDNTGTFVSLPREQFTAVDSFLRHVFGPPSQEPKDYPNGNKLGLYHTNAAGCGIFYSVSATNCIVTLLKPVITSRDIGGHHRWVAQIGKGKYGIYGNSAGTGIVIVQGSIFVPVPFWRFVALVGLSALVVVALLYFFIRRTPKPPNHAPAA